MATSRGGETPSLFGFSVESEVPLRFLRVGGGSERLRVSLGPARAERPRDGHIIDWPLKGSQSEVIASLYEVPRGYEYWTTDAGRFRVFPEEAHIEVPGEGDSIIREQRLNGVPMALAFTHRGDIALHAAAVEIEGEAVLLAAPSRFGKTTLALAFHEQGYSMLSEDLICVRPSTCEVFPGPSVIRLRPDVYLGVPPPGMEEVASRPDRVFLAPLEGRKGTSAPRGLRAVVFLREGQQIETCRASAVDAIKDLWHLNFRLPSSQSRGSSFRSLTSIVSGVPAWDLWRPYRLDALRETVAAIVRLVAR